MRKLITALAATAALLIAGSIAWKAEAATVTGLYSPPPLTKTYLLIEDCFLSPCSHPYEHNRYSYYGYDYRSHYNGYGYRHNDYGYRPSYAYPGYVYRPYPYNGSGYGWRY